MLTDAFETSVGISGVSSPRQLAGFMRPIQHPRLTLHPKSQTLANVVPNPSLAGFPNGIQPAASAGKETQDGCVRYGLDGLSPSHAVRIPTQSVGVCTQVATFCPPQRLPTTDSDDSCQELFRCLGHSSRKKSRKEPHTWYNELARVINSTLHLWKRTARDRRSLSQLWHQPQLQRGMCCAYPDVWPTLQRSALLSRTYH